MGSCESLLAKCFVLCMSAMPRLAAALKHRCQPTGLAKACLKEACHPAWCMSLTQIFFIELGCPSKFPGGDDKQSLSTTLLLWMAVF